MPTFLQLSCCTICIFKNPIDIATILLLFVGTEELFTGLVVYSKSLINCLMGNSPHQQLFFMLFDKWPHFIDPRLENQKIIAEIQQPMKQHEKFVPSREISMNNSVYIIGALDSIPAVLFLSPIKPTAESLDIYLKAQKTLFRANDVYSSINIQSPVSFKYTLACPATNELIDKLTSGYIFKAETYPEYLRQRDRMVESYAYPITENIKVKRDEMSICIENEHITMLQCPPSDNISVACPYIIVFQNRDWRTVRDLSDHSFLKKIRDGIYSYLPKTGLRPENVLMYFDVGVKTYPLYFYLYDLTKTNSNMHFSGWPLLYDELLQNIALDPNFYKNNMYYLIQRSEM